MPDPRIEELDLIQWLQVERTAKATTLSPLISTDEPTAKVVHGPIDADTCDGHMACRRSRDGPF